MSSIDDPVEAYRQADRRLRQALLGDGMYTPGLIKGEEGRTQVARELGRMRDAFLALRDLGNARAGETEALVADLEEVLRKRVASRTNSPPS
jgi:hypothetical protein